jgi:hypothetical protein
VKTYPEETTMTYCDQPACPFGNPGPAPASVLISSDQGQSWLPTCQTCARLMYQTHPADPPAMAPLSEWTGNDFERDFASVTGAPAQSLTPAAPVQAAHPLTTRPQVRRISSGAWLAYIGFAAVSFLIGCAVPSIAWSIFFMVLLPVIVAFLWACARAYDKASPVEKAAMVAAGGLALADAHRRHQKNVAASQAHAAQYKAGAAQAERDKTQQAILDQLQQQGAQGPVPASGMTQMTPRSDIYGNMT